MVDFFDVFYVFDFVGDVWLFGGYRGVGNGSLVW